jgi:hypothetical protein
MNAAADAGGGHEEPGEAVPITFASMTFASKDALLEHANGMLPSVGMVLDSGTGFDFLLLVLSRYPKIHSKLSKGGVSSLRYGPVAGASADAPKALHIIRADGTQDAISMKKVGCAVW